MRNTENKDKGRNAGGNFLNYILDQLSDVENFRFKKIFGVSISIEMDIILVQ